MDAKPKLLLIVTSSAWGGAERYVSRLAIAAKAQFEVSVVAGSSRGFDLFKSLPADVKTIEVAELRRNISLWNDLSAVRVVRDLIDREGYDLVHSNSSKAGLIAAFAVRLSKRRPPLIFTAHGWGFLEKRSLFFQWMMFESEKISSNWRTATIVLTGAERDVALERGLSTSEGLHLIPLGIDPDEISFLERDEARDELAKVCGTRLERQVIGTIANAYPAKNLMALLKAFDALAGEFPDLDLVILGDGPEMPSLLSRRDKLLHRDRACLPGAIKDAATLLKGFDIFVLPSTKEGLPWAILEASLAGLPIVATRVGALPELIEDGVNGLLVPPGDVGALITAIRSLLIDRDLFQKIKSGVSDISGRRSGSAMIAATLDLYRGLIRRS
jgi:glycosyltransferase involved in cell wall biosynthesis